MNRGYANAHPDQTELEARIASYELAFRMQAEAPGAVDLGGCAPSQATGGPPKSTLRCDS